MGASVAIAVVSWNTRDLLAGCLRSLERDADAGRAEVWVVDNASSDGSADLVRERFAWVKLIESRENIGFGRAVNLVAKRSEAPWLAPTNADIELTPVALETLLQAGDRAPRAGAIAPQLIGADGIAQHSVYAFPTIPFTAAFNLGLYRLIPGLGDRLCLEGHWNPERPRAVDWAIAAFLLVRRVAWLEAGGFDERQWMYAEDLDLGWRLSRAGWETLYEPGAHVRHLGAAATAQVWGDGRTERWLASTYAWMLRRRGLARTRICAAINVAGAAARWALLTPASRRRPQVAGASRAQMRGWAALHARNGFASRQSLEHHA